MTDDGRLSGPELATALCPYCGDRPDKGERPWPEPGFVTICIGCANFAVYTEDGLRKVTADEEAELLADEDLVRLKKMAEMIVALQRPFDPEVTHIGSATVHEDGSVTLDDPDDDPDGTLSSTIADAVEQVEVAAVARDIQQHVTPEVAHHVLSAYDEPDASMPPLSVISLIGLIRICLISDDTMLYALNSLSEFHGYVLAVTGLAEEPGGIALLKSIAGLDGDNDQAAGHGQG